MLLLEGFKLGKEEDSKLVDLLTFWKIVGKLIYLTNIKLNVAYVVGVINYFMCDLKQVHLEAAKTFLSTGKAHLMTRSQAP